MKSLVIHPEGVCSREIHVDVDDNGIITACQFIGGCQGNTTGVSKLIIGMKASEVVSRLSGIACRGSRNGDSSCPDQLARGLKENL